MIVVAAWVAGRALAPSRFGVLWPPLLREPLRVYGVRVLLVLLWAAVAPTTALSRLLLALPLVVLLVAGLEGLRRQTTRQHPQ